MSQLITKYGRLEALNFRLHNERIDWERKYRMAEHHVGTLYDKNQDLKIELKRTERRLETLKGLYSASQTSLEYLKKDKVRIIERKDNNEVNLCRACNEVEDLKADNCRLEGEVKFLFDCLDRVKPSHGSSSNENVRQRASRGYKRQALVIRDGD